MKITNSVVIHPIEAITKIEVDMEAAPRPRCNRIFSNHETSRAQLLGAGIDRGVTPPLPAERVGGHADNLSSEAAISSRPPSPDCFAPLQSRSRSRLGTWSDPLVYGLAKCIKNDNPVSCWSAGRDPGSESDLTANSIRCIR